MGLIHSLNERIFHHIHNKSLVYNACWEDPRCDRQLLQLTPMSRVVVLTSAGCNALDYLLDDVAHISCVDVNPRQNALLQFKVALFEGSDYDTLFRFFGDGKFDRAREVFYDCVFPRLHDAFSRRWWEYFIDAFSGRGLRPSFYWHGSSGVAAWLIRQWLRVRPSAWKMAQALFAAKDMEEQAYYYDKLEPCFFTPLFTWALRQHAFQSMLGVPTSQQKLAAAPYSSGLVGYFVDCLRRVLRNLPLQDNYFWKLYFYGHYTSACCPNYLKSEYFSVIRQRVSRISTHTSTLSEFLKQHPGQYTHFVLLDHQDWMAREPAMGSALEEEWRLILDNAAPGAYVLMRSAARELDFLPNFIQRRVVFDIETAERVHRQDRVGTYASTWIGQIVL
ncbi:MAG: BtaA family protein [Saprospiraceae bacterium]|nr:BtaA family protein [Saprospiraceae bacterium]MDW8483839.1 BtaA family protein [Saprospiraceae bacterium]